MKFNKYIYLLFGLVILLYGVYAYYQAPDYESNRIEITDLNHFQVNLPSNQPFIVCFIQTWCKDCFREIPLLMQFSATHKIPIYLVTDESHEKIEKMRARFKMEIPIYLSKTKLKELGIRLYPTFYFYGTQGELLSKQSEKIKLVQLEEYLKKLK